MDVREDITVILYILYLQNQNTPVIRLGDIFDH